MECRTRGGVLHVLSFIIIIDFILAIGVPCTVKKTGEDEKGKYYYSYLLCRWTSRLARSPIILSFLPLTANTIIYIYIYNNRCIILPILYDYRVCDARFIRFI